MLHRTTITTALAALVLALAACGGDDAATPGVTVDQEEFRTAVRDAQAAAEETARNIAGSTSKDEVADALRTGAASLDDAADRLDEADAPEGAQDAAHDLVTAARELADGFEQAASNVESGDLGDLADTASQVQSLDALERLNRAVAELRERGVDVPTVEGE